MGSTVFNGTTSVGTITHHTDLNMQDWTIAGWVKVTGTGEGDYRLFNKASGSNAGALQVTGMAGGTTLRGRQITSGPTAIAISHNSSDVLTLNSWVCVFVTCDIDDLTQRIRIYKYNGTNAVTEVTYSSVTNSTNSTTYNTNDLYVGNTSDGSLTLDGKMAYWALDDIVWSTTQMLEFAQGTLIAGLPCFWPMQGDGSNDGVMSARTISFTNTTFDGADSPPVSYGAPDDVFIVDRPSGLWLAGPRTFEVVRSLQLVDFPSGVMLGGHLIHQVSANSPGDPEDDFNRPNQVGLGGAWVEHSGSWAISNQEAISTAAPGVASLANVADVNTYVEINIPPTGDVVVGCANRVLDQDNLVGAEIVRTATEQKVIVFRRIAGVDRELGSTGLGISSGVRQLELRTIGRDVMATFEGIEVLHCRLSDSEHAALTGTRTGLVTFSFPAGTWWDNFITDTTPAPIVIPQMNGTFNHANVGWLESGGSTNGWHEWAGTSPSWQVIDNTAAQLTTGYAPVTVPVGAISSFGVTVQALGEEFWILFRARDHENYYRFGRSGSGNYTVQKIEANGLGTISGESNPGGTITPLGGDRLVVTERSGPGFDCYVVRAGTPTLFWSATDTEWEEYYDQAGLAAFNSVGLRFEDFLAEGASGDLEMMAPLPTLDLVGELTSISSDLDIDAPLPVLALVGEVPDTVSGVLDATAPMPELALVGAGPNSGTFDAVAPLPELALTANLPDPIGTVNVRPYERFLIDAVFPMRWPPPRKLW